MDINSIAALGLNGSLGTNTVGGLTENTSEDFGTVLSSAMNLINDTNALAANAEAEEIKFALGESENTHDLSIAMKKAETALQFTVAVKNGLLDAYKEIMNMQI